MKDIGIVMPKFHYIYLAQNLLKTRFPTSFEQKKSRETWSYDKIDLMEFGLYQSAMDLSDWRADLQLVQLQSNIDNNG